MHQRKFHITCSDSKSPKQCVYSLPAWQYCKLKLNQNFHDQHQPIELLSFQNSTKNRIREL